MSTTHARFDGWEERWAKYFAHDATASLGLPGMTVSAIPSTISARAAYVRLITGASAAAALGAISARIYPNAWSAVASKDATYEPTAVKWDTYAPVGRTRTAANWNVALVGGDWQISNAIDMVFTAPGAGTTAGCTIYGALFCLRNWDVANAFDYALLYDQLDTPLAIPIGGGPSPLFAIDAMKFIVR